MYDTRHRILNFSTEGGVAEDGFNGIPRWSTVFSVQPRFGYETVYSYRGPKQKKDDLGWIPPNDFMLERVNCHRSGGACQRVDHNGSGYYFNCSNAMLGGFFGDYIHQPIIDFEQLNQLDAIPALKQAQLEAYSDANGPDLPGAVWLAEGKETVEWLKDIAMGVLKHTRKFKSALKQAKKAAKKTKKGKTTKSLTDDSFIAGQWLQYRYAIMPLMLQIKEIMDILEAKQGELKTTTGRVKTKKNVNTQTLIRTFGSSIIKTTIKEDLEMRGNCKLYPSAVKQEFDWGVKPYDLLIAYWNVVRLSFVIDWFLNVGTLLSAYRPGDANVRYQSSTVVYKYTRTVESELIGNTIGPWSEHKFQKEVLEEEAVWVNRDTLVTKPSLPGFNVKSLSLMRQFDAAALLFGALKALK